MSDTQTGTATGTRIVVVGGVAGGASAAARARRLDERASIVVFERGEDASFANCGLPYYLGGEIAQRERLLVAGDRELKSWLNLDVRTKSEVVAIDREARQVDVRDVDSGNTYREPYDHLILSMGAAPIRPEPLLKKVGHDHPRVLSLRNLPDIDRIKEIVDQGIDSAVVVGGGFIGLEVVEQLVRRKVHTSLVEMLPQVMPPMDAEMAEPLHQALVDRGVNLYLNDKVADLEPHESKVQVRLEGGKQFPVDLVVLAVGVRPESDLARRAGLELTERGAIRVDGTQETSDPNIYAVGDVVEVKEAVLGGTTFVPLGGPANRQGRLAADRIATKQGTDVFADEQSDYRGSQGTSIVRVFDLAAGMTGLSEKALLRLGKCRGTDYDVVSAHPNSHAGYYPGATPLAIKLIYEKPSGRVLGAQAIGTRGIDKRIDVVAMAIQMGATVYDLEQTELCYAPPFGSAKDPVNMLGFMAANTLRGLTKPVHADELDRFLADSEATLVDVRTAPEVAAGSIPSAIHVPLEELRGRLGEIPRDRPVVVYCKVGQRGYFAERILRQNGFDDVRNLNGGYVTWKHHYPDSRTTSNEVHVMGNEKATGAPLEARAQTPAFVPPPSETETLDVRGMQCPGPLMQATQRAATMPAGAYLKVLASDPGFTTDVAAWCKSQGHRLLEAGPADEHYVALLQVGPVEVPATEASRGEPAPKVDKGQTIVVFSGDLDRVLAAFVIANGAAAMGHPVTMFFTFWGLNALRKEHPPKVKKGLLDRMFGMMMPRGANKLALSKMNMAGMGTAMMKHVMRSKGVASLPELIDNAREQGVKMVACTMSMEVMGIQADELADGLEYGGVGAYIGDAEAARMNLFI